MTVEEAPWEGYTIRECQDHRTVGPHRAWCYACTEWCYPEVPCKGCEIPIIKDMLAKAEREKMANQYPIDDRHALYIGWVLGCAMRAGVGVRPVIDDEGNYTDKLELVLPKGRLGKVDVTVTFIVPPPPEDWTFPDD